MTESTRINVGVRAFAALREALGFAEATVSVAPGTDIAGQMARLNELYPRANLGEQRYGVALNRSYAPMTAVLADGDEVALIPPVSGGAVNPDAAKLFEISDQPLSLDDVMRRIGAVSRYSPAPCAASPSAPARTRSRPITSNMKPTLQWPKRRWLASRPRFRRAGRA